MQTISFNSKVLILILSIHILTSFIFLKLYINSPTFFLDPGPKLFEQVLRFTLLSSFNLLNKSAKYFILLLVKRLFYKCISNFYRNLNFSSYSHKRKTP